MKRVTHYQVVANGQQIGSDHYEYEDACDAIKHYERIDYDNNELIDYEIREVEIIKHLKYRLFLNGFPTNLVFESEYEAFKECHRRNRSKLYANIIYYSVEEVYL